MEVQLRFSEPNEKPLDPAILREYGRIIYLVREKKLWPVLDVCVKSDGGWVLVLPLISGHPLSLSETARAMTDVETPCSIALSLAEVFMVLHQAHYRKGIAFDWSECTHVAHDPSGWCLAVKPPTPAQYFADRSNKIQFDPRYTAPEQIVSFFGAGGATGITEPGDSYTLGTILYELLTGKPVFSEADQAINAASGASVALAANSRQDLPASLIDFMNRSLSPMPQMRPSLKDWRSTMGLFGGRSLPPPAVQASRQSKPDEAAGSNEQMLTSIMGKPPVSGRLLKALGNGAANVDFSATLFLSGSGNDLPPGMYGAAMSLMVRGGVSPTPSNPVYQPNNASESQTPSNADLPPGSITSNFNNRSPGILGADPVDCTVFAPPEVKLRSNILVQVFLHTPDQAETAKQLAQEFDNQSHRLGYHPLEVDLPRGTAVSVELYIPGMEIDDPLQRVVWQGRTTSVQFGVSCPASINMGNVLGKATVYLESVPIGHIRFKLEVTAENQPAVQPQPLGSQSQRYHEAFISYSSHDRDEVLKRVQMLERFQIRVFQDVLDLQPGMQWEQELYRHIDSCDLFLLFWSNAAKESPWVDKEVRRALARKGIDEAAAPEIIPIVIEGPPVPMPPPHLAHLHFNDKLLYFMTPHSR